MIGALPDFRLETWFSKWEFAAAHSFTASDAQTMSVAEVLGLAGLTLDDIGGIDLGYRPTHGTHELREAVAAQYDIIAPDDVLAFAGAQEALFWLLADLLRDGGHAVVTVPNYQSIETVPLASPASVSGLTLWTGTGADLRWTLDLDRVAELLRPDTRVVAVNFPNNPTGFVPDRDTFVALARMCHDRGIVLVSDEVYRGIEVDPEDHVAARSRCHPVRSQRQRDVEVLRVAWSARRLGRDPGSGTPRPSRAAQTLHEHLQPRPDRASRCRRAQRG